MTDTPWQRLWVLLTGVVSWIDHDTGKIEQETVDWRTRWALAGIHSYNWWWVRRWGGQACGCTVNPLTRRRVLTDFDCLKHGFPSLVTSDGDRI